MFYRQMDFIEFIEFKQVRAECHRMGRTKTVHEFGAQVASLETQVAKEKLDNFNRREFYSKVELLRLDIEETVSVGKCIYFYL